MTFGELVDGIGAKIGVGIENAGGAAALQIDGETIIVQARASRAVRSTGSGARSQRTL